MQYNCCIIIVYYISKSIYIQKMLIRKLIFDSRPKMCGLNFESKFVINNQKIFKVLNILLCQYKI